MRTRHSARGVQRRGTAQGGRSHVLKLTTTSSVAADCGAMSPSPERKKEEPGSSLWRERHKLVPEFEQGCRVPVSSHCRCSCRIALCSQTPGAPHAAGRHKDNALSSPWCAHLRPRCAPARGWRATPSPPGHGGRYTQPPFLHTKVVSVTGAGGGVAAGGVEGRTKETATEAPQRRRQDARQHRWC